MIILSLLTIGNTSAYAPGVFREVVYNRQAGITSHDLGEVPEDVTGFIAVSDCSLIGRKILACFDGGGCEKLLIADCAGVADGGKTWMQEGGYAGEVSWNIWEKYKIPNEVLRVRLYLFKLKRIGRHGFQ